MEVVLVPGERLGPRTYPRVWSACVDTKSVGPPRRISSYTFVLAI